LRHDLASSRVIVRHVDEMSKMDKPDAGPTAGCDRERRLDPPDNSGNDPPRTV